MPDKLPQLPLMEGLDTWGQVRLSPKHLENVITVELCRRGTHEWKPIFTLAAMGGKVAFKVEAEHNSRLVVYDAITNTFSDLTR